MKTTLVSICLLLTALSSLPVAGAAALPGLEDVCETAKCHVEDPPAGVACRLTEVGVGTSCVYWVDGASCMFVEWGVHQPGLVVGGYHTCNVVVWVQPGEFVQLDAAAAKPCDVSPTWPGGHATCTVAGRTVGCAFWTGATLLGDRDSVACGATGCTGGFHFDGRPVNGGVEGCVVYVNVDAGAQEVLEAIAVGAANPCTVEQEVGCSTPVGSCSVFLNRWSYGDCESGVVPCLNDELTAEWGRLSVYANTCGAGFHLVG